MQKYMSMNEKIIITLSVIFTFLAVYFFMSKELAIDDTIDVFSIETFNIKNMATTKIAYKNGLNNALVSNIEDKVITSGEDIGIDNSLAQKLNAIPEVKWQLPVKTGRITNWLSYSHVAIDITSPNGVYETIYPIAVGTISGIYKDRAGANVVTVHHYIDGVNYTSQYVHLSSYAPGLYVGKSVTINDSLGQMGATGIATGVHLHISVVDCVLFDPNDSNCKNLGGYFNYLSRRYSQGFRGLNELIYVPNSW